MIPRPARSANLGSGTTLADGMVIAASGPAQVVAALLATELEAATGWHVHRDGPDARNFHGVVRLEVKPVQSAGRRELPPACG